MSVEPVAAPRPASAPAVRLLVGLSATLCTLLLAAATVGPVPRLAGVGVAAAATLALHTVLLVWLSLAIHHRHHSFGPCRGVGFVCLALFCSGVTVALATLVRLPAGAAAGLAATGLAAASVCYVLGMLMLPGAMPDVVVRLRQVLDGVGIALCFVFIGWLLVVAPTHTPRRLALLSCLVAATVLAVAVTTATRAVHFRSAARTCAAGAGTVVTGLTLLAFVRAGAVGPHVLPLAGACLAYGPLLTWSAARRYSVAPRVPHPAEANGSFAGHPLLVLPVAGVLVAAAYHLLTVHSFDAVGAALGCAVVAAVTARETFAVFDIRRYAREVSRQEAHFRSLVAGSSDVTFVLDAGLLVRWQSPAAARQLGLSDQDVLGHPFTALVHPDDLPAVRERLAAVLTAKRIGDTPPALLSARVHDGFGHWRDTESTISDQRAVPEVGALVIHLRDVGERRELERTLHRMAFTDQLTGLANRRQLLRTVTAMRGVPGQPGALLVIELDGFTAVNDVRGHEVGDAVLIEVARRLRDAAEETDVPARLSGDEFAVVTAGNPVQSYALATRVLTMLGQPYQLPGATVHLGASVGLAELADATSTGDVLSRAALALRRAAQLRRSRIEWYDEALEAALLRRLTLEQELPGVVDRGELDLVYQPVVDLVEGIPVGAEALLRWRHPTLGTVVAADFVPVAEDLGLIDEIGHWALHRACRQLSSWLREGHDLWLAVNLAARQLAAPDLVPTVGSVLDTHQVPAERLVLEVTERSLGTQAQGTIAQLAGLRALGARTCLAQFGTGATPLAHLRRLPIDALKLDRVLFADPAGRAGPATPIIDVVVSLGRRLGLELVAEGLEDQDHLETVRGAGCRYGQGYLFGRPEPAEHFEAFLETHRSPA